MAKLPDCLLLLFLPFRIFYHFLKAVCLALTPDRLRKKKNLSSEIVVITGGGSGIGRCLALQLARTGAQIVIWDVNATGAEVVRQEITQNGGRAFVYQCDVSDRQQVYAVASRVQADVGPVSVLVNNAGIVNGRCFLDTPDEDVLRVMGVNTLGNFWTVKAILPSMMDRDRGHIVTVASVAGYAGICRMADYCASKAAIIAFHETLALEIRSSGKRGILTTLVCPFLTRTGLFEGAQSRFPFLIPMLEPDYLAGQIARSIVLEERHLVLPHTMRFLLPLYRILPTAILESEDDIFGQYSCMEQFAGNTSTAKSA
ncbi:Epidermal retinol dehydrogenase 2 [Hypsibius exemplaris]|uniref:Short-chain dehydrogenase/reductase 3 n=1 Tax=Hypsibius exemplaris TaxID=2072580 RepID=A0A1W0X4B9_HYPEX|nr:Epidermal retinol dehydrogenase 2 [Hypsibius exemplaris]